MEQQQDGFLAWISMSGSFLGALFYFEPSHPKATGLVKAINEINWKTNWVPPLINDSNKIKKLLRQTENISEQFQRQFIGPNAMPAPPWASVYLDPEAVIYGNSLIALREFMTRNGLKTQIEGNVPEDHIGLMLMLASYIADAKPDVLKEYLSEHLFTWVWRYLELLASQEESPFYRGLALVTQQTLAYWREELQLDLIEAPLYF
ncbi:Tat proofreading chaperone DmsD [Gallibacterium melopsittaci]|uniref:Tat proofreading chaperone DmsD n=1 Tax=Gallibacterium melopsittaci TaxID=516063 RepID=A0ABV6HU65_9PAST